jgi:hypothetical protein
VIVSLYSEGIEEFIEIESPKNGDIIDLDFNGKFLIQVKYKNKKYIPTGNGIDGGGNPLHPSFYKKIIIE